MKSGTSIPKHVAIIPDGNRRWAKKRGLKPWEGHIEGGIGKNAEDVAQTALDEGVKYLTLWLGSYTNLLKRSTVEIKMLNRVYRAFIKKMLKDERTKSKDIGIRFVGEWDKLLERSTIKLIKEVHDSTKNHKKHILTALLGYSGDREIVSAINKLLSGPKKTATNLDIKRALWTAGLPPVDFLIRTGVDDDPHNSAGFMMWHTQNSQLYFSDKMWPDFTKEDFLAALKSYSERERRLGK